MPYHYSKCSLLENSESIHDTKEPLSFKLAIRNLYLLRSDRKKELVTVPSISFRAPHKSNDLVCFNLPPDTVEEQVVLESRRRGWRTIHLNSSL